MELLFNYLKQYKKILSSVAALIVFILGGTAAFTVLAVGGGGGGSVPTCDADIWNCGDWSTCSALGGQTRTCTLTFDCSTAATPKPAESQSCTPPTPPVPRAPETETSTPPRPPLCTADTWTCAGWSARCDVNGINYRSCELSFDCPSVVTPEPPLARPCQTLQCGVKETLRDRVACRLNLAPAGIARELQIQYLPEECRATSDKRERAECIERYKSFQPCWNTQQGEQRFFCARNVLKLGPVVSEEVKTCQGKKGADQVACKAQLKEKVLYMIAFRFYDLETRAEELGNRGADLNAIADFETTVELKKQAFDKAANNEERRVIILEVRAAWQDFVKKIKDQVK